MGKKYIIELESGTHIFVLGPEGIVHIGEPDVVYETVDGMQIGDAVINAKPYTEPDLEQVRKEAYDSGYDDAKGGYENGFENGMIVAWDAARKISMSKIDGGFSWESMNNMFGTDSPSKIYKTFTASEAIEKIRQYEQENEEIKIGDEVTAEHGDSTFTVTWMSDRCICGIDSDGRCYSYELNEVDGKTGNHHDIATVLEKMRGEQDG